MLELQILLSKQANPQLLWARVRSFSVQYILHSTHETTQPTVVYLSWLLVNFKSTIDYIKGTVSRKIWRDEGKGP
jgi:hypothetical protein